MSVRIGGRVYVAGDGVDVRRLLGTVGFPGRGDEYAVIVAGGGFGGRESDEAVLRRLRAAGIRVVVAESFSPSFMQRARHTGAVLAIESEYRLCDAFETGDCVEVDLGARHLRDANGSAAYPLKHGHDIALTERAASAHPRTGTDG